MNDTAIELEELDKSHSHLLVDEININKKAEDLVIDKPSNPIPNVN